MEAEDPVASPETKRAWVESVSLLIVALVTLVIDDEITPELIKVVISAVE